MKSVDLYTNLLRLYPRAFRDAYGDQMRQVFADSYQQVKREHRSMIGFWLTSLVDLAVNAAAERLARFRATFRWQAAVRDVGGLALLLTSGFLLWWSMWAFTVFLLVPWDIGIPPAGTFAGAVNSFFEADSTIEMTLLENVKLLANLLILCELVAIYRRRALAHQSRSAICWHFARLNLLTIVGLAIAAFVGLQGARILFPDWIPWEGDQSHGIALVYWGLLVAGTVLTVFVRQVWTVKPAPRLKTHEETSWT